MLTKHLDLMFKHLAVTFTTILAVSVLVAACANSNGEESTSPGVTQDVVTSEVAESAQVNDEGVFVRVVAPLDEARGYCLDIPGHMTSVRLESPLHVHTCKHGIWNQDGRFDAAALRNGVLRMPHYELCLEAENHSIGARLLLTECTQADLQTWTPAKSRWTTRLRRNRVGSVSSDVHFDRRGTGQRCGWPTISDEGRHGSELGKPNRNQPKIVFFKATTIFWCIHSSAVIICVQFAY